MNIELIVENKDKQQIYDLSNVAQDIEWTVEMEGNPGKLSFSYIDKASDNHVIEGSTVSLKVKSQKVFWGYVFKISKNEDREVSVTCYDQLRYLKNKDTYIFESATATDVFRKICNDHSIKYSLINSSSYLLEARIYDNKTLAEMIQYTFDKTLIDTGEWYFMRDNFGTLEMLEVSQQVTNIVVGDKSLLTGYSFESSIDGDTYNQVKLVKENQETKKREVYIVKDSSNINRWGLLQYYETVDESMNDAQIRERANTLLRYYNKPQKSLKVTCIGQLDVRAGCGIVLMIKDLQDEMVYQKNVIVYKVSHSFKNNEHSMELEVLIN